MKLTKRVLSMVLCGLVVLGGSQAALVKADAQIVPGNDQYTGNWTQEIRFGMRKKGLPGVKSGWSMNLVHKNGHLRLDGPTNVGSSWTFGDTFKMGWKKKNGTSKTLVFRGCSGSAANALSNVKKAFNDANLEDGDKFFAYGEQWETSLTFPHSSLMIKGIQGNDYSYGYQKFMNKNVSGFRIDAKGLYEARMDQN